MNPYHRYVSELARLVREGRGFPLGGFAIPPRPAIRSNTPPALIFSPHPDDECIIGALPLRLMREGGVRVVNVAVTQGSNKARQAARLVELKDACDYLGFELLQTAPQGLENINVKARSDAALTWRASVDIIAAILTEHRPSVVFFPHDTDWNSTHIGTHHLLVDALTRQPADFSCHVVETEFWGAMATPNLMVESSVTDLADMMTALSFHVGEVQRNPYHLLVPAWMQDNVRRGGELVGGQGGAAPDFVFCTLYRLRQWSGGQLRSTYVGGRTLPADVNASTLFGPTPS
ncbi:MAG TPA: PIG-L family deacetylase [Vicinamibacterales bacterium]|jgi:LmbE family N-acetylglucosaminyl deacetylase|nr:PIG-L family deacetylase [Vicinamibacterales bacterium]